jgi:membrane-associated phospholipid phosphatase
MARRSIEPILEPAQQGRKPSLRVGESALLLALLAMSALAWLHPAQVPISVRMAHLTVAALFAVAALALGLVDGGWARWVKELLPVPVLPYIFLSLGRLIPLVNPRSMDPLLLEWDRRILGAEAQTELYALHLPSWTADLLTVAYSSYFFLAIALVVTLIIVRDRHLPQVAAAIILTFLLSYLGYFVVPAYGPRTTVAVQRYASLPDGMVGGQLRDLLDTWERTKTDAFPSGHTMVTLAILYCARRRFRPLYNAILPIGSLLIAATVLLTYHYIVDVIAAIPLTVVSLSTAALLAGPVPAACSREPSEPHSPAPDPA